MWEKQLRVTLQADIWFVDCISQDGMVWYSERAAFRGDLMHSSLILTCPSVTFSERIG